MLHDIPAETIYSQIPHICRLTRDEADDRVEHRDDDGDEAVVHGATSLS